MRGDLKSLIGWLAGIIVLAGAAWGSWVTSSVTKNADVINIILQSVARIETKVDILLDEKAKK